MKKAILVLTALIAGIGAAAAQNYMVIDSKKVFESIPDYTKATAEIEADAKNYQKQIDDAFNVLETNFNNYQGAKAAMTAADRAATEQRIVNRENEITKFQEEVFGEKGAIAQKREKLLKPIQERVSAAIAKYATEKNFDIVLDISAGAGVLWHKPAVDATDAIIAIVK